MPFCPAKYMKQRLACQFNSAETDLTIIKFIFRSNPPDEIGNIGNEALHCQGGELHLRISFAIRSAKRGGANLLPVRHQVKTIWPPAAIA